MKSFDLHSDTLLKAFMGGYQDLYDMDSMSDPGKLEKGNYMAQCYAIFMPSVDTKMPEGVVMPSDEEYRLALETLERVNWDVDYVVTHCGPTSIVQQLDPRYESDPLTDFLERIRKRIQCHYWLFGHYHDNQIIDDKYVLLWERIVQVL